MINSFYNILKYKMDYSGEKMFILNKLILEGGALLPEQIEIQRELVYYPGVIPERNSKQLKLSQKKSWSL